MDPPFTPVKDRELEGLVTLLYHLDRAHDDDGVQLALPHALERAIGHDDEYVFIFEGSNGTRQATALPVSGFLQALQMKYVEKYYAG